MGNLGRWYSFAVMLSIMVAAGCGSDSGADPGTSSPSGGGSSPQPKCRTVQVTNAVGAEKLNAAFCFGLGFTDNYHCTYAPANNATTCTGSQSGFVVHYRETSNGTVGDVTDLSNGQNVGSIVQGPTGSFDISVVNGAQGSCVINGDVARLCVP